MDKIIKEQKLRDFAKSVIDNPDVIEYLLRYFNLTKEQ